MDNNQGQAFYLSQERDFWGNLRRDLQELQGISTLVYELIQNADDVKTLDGKPGGASEITFDIQDKCLIVTNNGVFSDCGHLNEHTCPWVHSRGHRCDFHRMKQVGGGDKRNESNNTGAFGIGFNAVYQITDHPEIISSGYHLFIHPELEQDKRIYVQPRSNTIGTQIILPWAYDAGSMVRKELRVCPAVNKNQITGFVSEIQRVLPLAAIFLKQLISLKLLHNGRLICQVDRSESNGLIEISVNNKKTIWHIFRSDFASEADDLRQQLSNNSIETTRRSEVMIAVPNSVDETCFLFADLPTETSTRLPFHICADFYPTSDRKRIILDESIRAKWNRLAIRSAAKLVVQSFNEITKLYSPLKLWDWIAEIRKGGKEDPLDSSFEDFWGNLSGILPDKQIVVTSREHKTFVNSVCLLESPAEIEATEIWENLHIDTVHGDLRKHYAILQELGVKLLRLSDIVQGLKKSNVIGSLSFEKAPRGLKTKDGLRKLWKAINLIWNSSTRTPEREKVQEELSLCAIAVGVDGCLHAPAETYIGDELAQEIFPEIIWLKNISDTGSIPNQLCCCFDVNAAIRHLKSLGPDEIEARWISGRFSIKRFYNWLENHRDEIQKSPTLITELNNLPIWPAAGKLHTTSKLYLPGGFEDQLGLASIIDIAALGGRSEFLRDILRVKPLDFLTYIREQIGLAFRTEDLANELRYKIVQQLALRLGEFRDYSDIRYILQKLPLVKSQDGDFHEATLVYFDNNDTRILGDDLNLAVMPAENASSVEQLYEWLGVARQPRNEEVLKRIKNLVSSPPTPSSRQAIEALFAYLVKCYKAFLTNDGSGKSRFEQDFETLKKLQWLPGSRNLEEWFSPDVLFASYSKYLFESQGNFLEFPLPLQREANDFLDFLLIKKSPFAIHIVNHILYCSENQIAVNWEVYIVLNRQDDNKEKETIRKLEGEACILVSEDPVEYVRPNQVFWNEHPFGKYRYQLGLKLRSCEGLFRLLGVREQPEIDDFIQVLLDISEKVGNNQLSEETLSVVMTCWRKLSDALSSDLIEPEKLKILCNKKVIPDPRCMLTLPAHLFFEDRAGLASRFSALLKNNVIQRTEGCWLAMEAVGVQLLSRTMQVDLVKEVESEPDSIILNRIRERGLLIQRIIDAEQTVGGELANYKKLLNLDYQRARELEIVFSIRVFNRHHSTDPEFAIALLKDDIFYAVWDGGEPPWAAICRELALALKPSGEIGSLAMGIKEVLSGTTYQAISDYLDEIGYPPLQSDEQTTVSAGQIIEGPSTEDIEVSEDGDGKKTPSVTPSTDNAKTGGTGRGSSSHSSNIRRRKSRLISYVYPDDELLPQDTDATAGEKHHKRTVTEQAGVKRVIEDENLYHRDAIDKNQSVTNHPGYDLESTDRFTGITRYIEVKALYGVWDASSPIMMTPTEFAMAKSKGSEYWLYIVERATGDDFKIYRIQNPANRVNYFVYDHGWLGLSNID